MTTNFAPPAILPPFWIDASRGSLGSSGSDVALKQDSENGRLQYAKQANLDHSGEPESRSSSSSSTSSSSSSDSSNILAAVGSPPLVATDCPLPLQGGLELSLYSTSETIRVCPYKFVIITHICMWYSRALLGEHIVHSRKVASLTRAC